MRGGGGIVKTFRWEHRLHGQKKTQVLSSSVTLIVDAPAAPGWTNLSAVSSIQNARCVIVVDTHHHRLALSRVSCMAITYSKSKDQPGTVANPARGQLNGGKKKIPVPVRAREFGLARWFWQSRPASACSSPYSGCIWSLLTGFLPSSAAASNYLFKAPYAIGSVPSFIRLRNCVPMAFTAESPPAQGQ